MKSASQTEARSGAWVCCACNTRPVVAVRAVCGHLYCHVCSFTQRSDSNKILLKHSNCLHFVLFSCLVCGIEIARDQLNYLA